MAFYGSAIWLLSIPISAIGQVAQRPSNTRLFNSRGSGYSMDQVHSLAIWSSIIFLFSVTPLIIHGIDLDTYQMAGSLFFTGVLFFITYKGMRQRIIADVLSDSDLLESKPDSENLTQQTKYLIQHMETEKPYLDPDLTLVDLAKRLSISRNQLSYVINAGVGDNFYSFVNHYRVMEVKRLIEQDKQKKYTIIALASDAGFKSKSSFYQIFKKITGLTPSEYRDGLF